MVTTGAELVFVDSNVFIAATDREREVHGPSMKFLSTCVDGQVRAFASGQVFREYAVVATRPRGVNGLGLPPGRVASNIQSFLKVVQPLEETRESLNELSSLIHQYQLKGKRIHDANLVAVMRVHGLRRIKTWNPADFKGFPGLELV